MKKPKPFCVYVAGKLSGGTFDYLERVRDMCRWGESLRRIGFNVYVPCWDLLQILIIGGLALPDVFDNSIGWLERSDAVFVIKKGPDGLSYKTSPGTKKEIARAKQLGIPVFYNATELMAYAKVQPKVVLNKGNRHGKKS